MLPSLFYTANIAHSFSLAEALRKYAGAKAYALHGKTPIEERRRLVRLFRAAEIDGLVSCGVLNEAADFPIAMGAFMACPTLSGLLYRQRVGRILRLYPARDGERPYQRDLLNSIYRDAKAGNLDLLAVLATGTGKTFTAAKLPLLVKHWKETPRGRLMFLVHLDELAQQSADTFARLNPTLRVGIEKADSYAGDADIVIGSVQTLGPEKGVRLRSFNPLGFDVLVTDESHHAAKGKYYHNIYRHFELFDAPVRSAEILHLGITATPARADNIGLESIFKKITYHYGLLDAVRDGWLCRVKAHRVETDTDISLVATRMSEYGKDFRIEPLADKINNEARNRLVAETYLKVCEMEGMTGQLSNIGYWRKPHGLVVDFCDTTANDLVTTPTLFGLKPGFNPKGGDLIAQMEEIESAEDKFPGLNLRAEPDMAAIHAVLRSIDILKAPVVPREITGLSRLPWLHHGTDSYHLGLMDHSMLTVRQNVLGKWEIHRHQRGVADFLCEARNLKEAVQFAEKFVPVRDKPALHTGAKWREKEPKEAQAMRLWQVSHRVREQFPRHQAFYAFCLDQYRAQRGYSRGALSDMITAALRP